MNVTDIKAHYKKDVRKATDSQLARLIQRDAGVELDSIVLDALQELAIDEAQRRGHAMPVLWALTRF